jgi:hypothetical protein
MTKTQVRLESLRTRGFDLSYVVRGGMLRVKCSQCESAVINGIAAHETGCPNVTHECKGCNEVLQGRRFPEYCESCQ